jgi:hypothetical protein
MISMLIAIRKTLFCTSLLLLGGLDLHAQSDGYPPYGDDPYDRGPVYRQPDGYGGGLGLYDRVQADLDRAAWDVDGSRRHIHHAQKEVGDVQRQLNRGRFDRDEMGEAIGAVQEVLNKDSLPDIDRDRLWRDLEQMRRWCERGSGRPRLWY